MPKIIKNGLEYSGVPTEVVTAWPPTGDSVLVNVPEMGNTDISEIGDGTITGSISTLKNGLSSVTTSLSNYIHLLDAVDGASLGDFNNATQTGFLRVINGQQATNPPTTASNVYGILVIMNAYPYIVQIWIPGASSTKSRKRLMIDGNWRAWEDF